MSLDRDDSVRREIDSQYDVATGLWRRHYQGTRLFHVC